MKKWRRWVLGGLLVLAVCWGWFARPMGLEEMFPGFRWAEAAEFPASFTCLYRQRNEAPDSRVDTVNLAAAGELDLREPEAAALVERLAQAKFSRSLFGTLWERIRPETRSGNDPDGYTLDLSFYPGRDGPDPAILTLRVFDRELTVSYAGTLYRCSMGGQEELMEDLLAYMKAHDKNSL